MRTIKFLKSGTLPCELKDLFLTTNSKMRTRTAFTRANIFHIINIESEFLRNNFKYERHSGIYRFVGENKPLTHIKEIRIVTIKKEI